MSASASIITRLILVFMLIRFFKLRFTSWLSAGTASEYRNGFADGHDYHLLKAYIQSTQPFFWPHVDCLPSDIQPWIYRRKPGIPRAGAAKSAAVIHGD